jgi:signal transduction histidine kinase
MKRYKFFSFFERIGNNLTIHQRVTLLTSGTIVILGLALIVFIDLIAPLFITNEAGVPDAMVLVTTLDESGNTVTALMETPAPEGYTILHDTNFLKGDPLSVIRALSVVGLVAMVGIGFFASKWVAKYALQPIVQISQATRSIDVRSLYKRLNYQGPSDEVKILADTIDSMLIRLDTNFEQQSHFVDNLAHELRTPLTSIRMNIEALGSNPEATLNDYQVLTQTEERAVLRLERLVEDLLLLAKGVKEIDQQSIMIGVLFEEIIEELTPLSKEHNITLKLDEEFDGEVRGDPVLLQRAITNLVKNGILYNHSGGYVTLSSRSENDQVVIEIRDNGIGIPIEQQDLIFERFYRVKPYPENNKKGKGLGLAIAAHIIDLHNGQIRLKSLPGEGSTFTVIIPKNQVYY